HPFGQAVAVTPLGTQDAWGNYRFTSELETSHNRFGFTGHYWDKEASLYYAKARYYDPFTARFTQADSFLGKVDDPPSLHRYAYAADNPTMYVDPSGHQTVGSQYCRAYSCGEGLQRNLNPAYAAAQSLNDTVNTVGGGVVIAADIIFRETLGNPGHMTPAGHKAYMSQVPKPKNDAEALIAAGLYFSALVAPLVKIGAGRVPAAEESIQVQSIADSPSPLPPSPRGLFERGTFRVGTVKTVVEEAPRNEAGEMLCPTCREVMPETIQIMTKNGPRERRGFDIDHFWKTWSDRVNAMKKHAIETGVWPTRKAVLDEYNRNVRAQCPPCNQGHQFEGPTLLFPQPSTLPATGVPTAAAIPLLLRKPDPEEAVR
ncbi:MAG: hypothetical protein K1X67_26560, partial [Fimbriimonadaceae bacterium]|nr:hypothetical protein [Fimbriimonadaceae bacterium]